MLERNADMTSLALLDPFANFSRLDEVRMPLRQRAGEFTRVPILPVF